MDMTRERLFPLSLSKKWPKNYVSKMGHSDPGISFFREGVNLSGEMGSPAPKTTHPQPAWASVLAQGVDEAKEL